jgi:hypothetical protein
MNFTDTQVATSETARGINRGIALNLIRRRQPISRANLAHAPTTAQYGIAYYRAAYSRKVGDLWRDR